MIWVALIGGMLIVGVVRFIRLEIEFNRRVHYIKEHPEIWDKLNGPHPGALLDTTPFDGPARDQ